MLVAMSERTDVIAAIASGPGNAAIGVVRLSGTGSHAIALGMCRDLGSVPESRTLTLVWLIHPVAGTLLDQAMAVFYAPGASYTGEESAELFCHGGRRVLEGVLAACLDVGARPAGPGEFTRRAVAGGRLDLAQAEAVSLLSQAPGEPAVGLALDALEGAPSRVVGELCSVLLDLLSECEAYLDFTDDDGVVLDLPRVMEVLEDALSRMEEWLLTERAGRPALEGVRIVLYGPPNAGKSSLFNALVGSARAIVHPDPGTTRDVVGECLTLGGASCLLLDTAGLRVSEGAVESEGVDRALEAARSADIGMLVIDGSEPGCADWVERWVGSDILCDLVVPAKADLWNEDPVLEGLPRDVDVVVTSARTGRGLSELEKRLGDRAAGCLEQGRVARCVVAGERQVQSLETARRHGAGALSGFRSGAPLEIVVADLRASVEALGEITGARVTDEILDRIFSRFCIGK